MLKSIEKLSNPGFDFFETPGFFITSFTTLAPIGEGLILRKAPDPEYH